MTNPKAWVKFESNKDGSGRFTVSPLDRGMGNTLGNALRRVLLSSLAGAAVTAIKIDGISHEFSTVKHCIEDVLDIICNIKGIVFKLKDNETKKVTLSFKGQGPVTAKSIETDSSVEIINPDQHIVELSEKGSITIDMIIEKGIGYQSAQLEKVSKDGVDYIAIDASFSPIVRVNHMVESIRVGKELDHDRLVLDVWTNHSKDAEDAVKEASNILAEKLSLFESINEAPEETAESEDVADNQKQQSALGMSIDDLELSARSSNCLKRAGIETVGELVEKDMSELIQIKNFGKKSADEINGKLAQFSLALQEAN